MGVKDLLIQDYELVTYNGFLLDHMLWKYWSREYAKIVDLMECFSLIYACERGWLDEDNTQLYAWQKLSTALSYYDLKDCNVDIYNPLDVIKKTRQLHLAMTANEVEAVR